MTIKFDEEKQKLKLDELRKRDEEAFLKTAAAKQNRSYVDLTFSPIDTDALRLIPEAKARTANIAAFRLIDKKLDIAANPPLSADANQIIEELKQRGYQITVFFASNESLRRAFEKYKELSFAAETRAGALDISGEEIVDLTKEVHSITDIKGRIEEVLREKKAYRISRIVEIILAGALSLDSSDIHIEPEEDYTRLRYRLDGVLNDILNIDRDTFNLVLSRVKLLSGLKLNIKTEPQDGRFTVNIKDANIEVRASILPGAYNESIVLRLLNPKTIALPLEELGMEPKLLQTLEREIRKPNGMILNTGPTGSGKTTTLYAFLKKVHNPGVKIITIENPIEYHLPGIVQTQTDPNKGYTFELGLRSALRQDPDVIMVGEIRDPETAKIAVNASLTGHLVFSTLHTNNAAGSFPRLIDLGINPKVLSSAINITMAQRLVRRLCPKCKKEVKIGDSDKKLISEILTSIKDPAYRLPVEQMWIAGSCKNCYGTGFRGRIGIFEAILMDKNVEEVIVRNPSEREIRSATSPQQILNLQQDGIVKILKGITSLNELRRVVDLESRIQT